MNNPIHQPMTFNVGPVLFQTRKVGQSTWAVVVKKTAGGLAVEMELFTVIGQRTAQEQCRRLATQLTKTYKEVVQ